MSLKSFFVCKNYTGLIKQITKEIYNKGLNIEKCQMIVTKENILIMDTLTIPIRKDIMESISNKYNEKNIISLINNETNTNVYKKKLNMKSIDNTGIIHITSRILSDNNIDIINLNTNSQTVPFTSSKIFDMSIVINTSKDVNNNIIENLLTPVLSKYDPEFEIEDL